MTFKYMTVQDCIRSNGERHLERAIAYISADYPDRFVNGSLRKAKREFKKADCYKSNDPILDKLAQMFAAKISNNIMKG